MSDHAMAVLSANNETLGATQGGATTNNGVATGGPATTTPPNGGRPAAPDAPVGAAACPTDLVPVAVNDADPVPPPLPAALVPAGVTAADPGPPTPAPPHPLTGDFGGTPSPALAADGGPTPAPPLTPEQLACIQSPPRTPRSPPPEIARAYSRAAPGQTVLPSRASRFKTREPTPAPRAPTPPAPPREPTIELAHGVEYSAGVVRFNCDISGVWCKVTTAPDFVPAPIRCRGAVEELTRAIRESRRSGQPLANPVHSPCCFCDPRAVTLQNRTHRWIGVPGERGYCESPGHFEKEIVRSRGPCPDELAYEHSIALARKRRIEDFERLPSFTGPVPVAVEDPSEPAPAPSPTPAPTPIAESTNVFALLPARPSHVPVDDRPLGRVARLAAWLVRVLAPPAVDLALFQDAIESAVAALGPTLLEPASALVFMARACSNKTFRPYRAPPLVVGQAVRSGALALFGVACLRLLSLKLSLPLALASGALVRWLPVPHVLLTPNVCSIRTAFRLYEFVERAVDVPPAHPHPEDARKRTAMTKALTRFVVAAGREPYNFLPGPTNASSGFPRADGPVGPDRAATPFHVSGLTDESVIVMVDTDHLLDLPSLLACGNPLVAYRCFPQTPCGTVDSSSWTTTVDGKIDVTVGGNAKYCHHVWDTSHDRVYVPCAAGYLRVNVETRRVDALRVINLLEPGELVAVVPEGAALLSHRNDVRFAPNAAGVPASVAETVTATPDGTFHHFCRPGDYVGASLPAHAMAMCASLNRSRPLDLHSARANLAAFFPNTADGNAMAALAATSVVSSYSFGVASQRPSVEPGVLAAAVSQLPRLPDIPFEVKFTGRYTSNPIIGSEKGALTKGSQTENWCIHERITKVRSQGDVPYSSLKHVSEFLTAMTPPVALQPLSIAEVVDLQRLPQQRARNLVAGLTPLESKGTFVKAFVKGELSAKPRNISTLPAHDTLAYSRYTLALAAHLKTRLPGYAFGVGPDTVPNRVREQCCRYSTCVATDFSAFDGTHNHSHFDLEVAFLRRCFPGHQGEIVRIHSAIRNAKAVTASGRPYAPDGTRISGSADTSVMNTLLNALVAYCALRRAGNEPAGAMARLGLYGGDDGLTFDIDPTHYEDVAKSFGLRLKAKVVCTSQPVDFLGRLYPSPQTSTANIGCPARTISGLPMSANNQFPPQVLLFNRAAGYIQTDSRSPIVGAWCRAVIRTTAPQYKVLRDDLIPWLSREIDTHSQATLPLDQAYECAATELGVTVAEIKAYEKLLDSLFQEGSMDYGSPLLPPLVSTCPTHAPGTIKGGIPGPFSEPAPRPHAPGPVEVCTFGPTGGNDQNDFTFFLADPEKLPAKLAAACLSYASADCTPHGLIMTPDVREEDGPLAIRPPPADLGGPSASPIPLGPLSTSADVGKHIVAAKIHDREGFTKRIAARSSRLPQRTRNPPKVIE